MSLSPSYLAGIEYELGAAVRLADIDEFAGTDVGIRLVDEGLAVCRVSDEPAVVMAIRAARRTLSHADVVPDSVVYCTDRAGGGTLTAELHHLLGDLDLAPDDALVVGGHGCGNLGPAINVATNALRGGSRGVLLVTADLGVPGERYLPTGLTALSDAAAACLVLPRPDGVAFEVLGTHTAFDPSLDVGVSDNARARAMAGGIRKAVGEVLKLTGEEGPVRHVIGGNYGRTSRRFLTMASGLGVAESYAPFVAEMAHCYSADGLITLNSLVPGVDLDDGDRLLVLSTGGISWTASMLRFRAS